MELAGARILVVEDETMIAMMIEDFLEELGCQVIAAASDISGDALAKGTTVTVDIALLDINLAGQLSYPVAHLLRTGTTSGVQIMSPAPSRRSCRAT